MMALNTDLVVLFISQARYSFVRGGHVYFGRTVVKEVFGRPAYCHVYVDKYNAFKGHAEYMTSHPDEYGRMTLREKNWCQVKSGYFVLLGNALLQPAQALDDYFCRTRIETCFKTSKEYLKLLPLCKWSDLTVRGKILSDVICSIIRQKLQELRRGSPFPLSAVIGKCQSLMCVYDRGKGKIPYRRSLAIILIAFSHDLDLINLLKYVTKGSKKGHGPTYHQYGQKKRLFYTDYG